MNEINTDLVKRCFLTNVRESVDALIELAESEANGSSLLKLVKNSVQEEFDKAAKKISDQINTLIRQYNDRECIIAGLSPEEKAKPNEDGSITTGQVIWMDIRKIGFKRIGETSTWQMTIDDEDVPCTGIPDELAMRLFKAIDAFRTARNDRRAAHE